MSDKATVFEDPKITVWCYPARGIVHHQIQGYVYGDLFRRALTSGAQAMRQHKGNKWLSDDRKNTALPPDDLDWVVNVWTPEALAAGWKYWALLAPEDHIGQMNIRRHVKAHAERGITIELFTTVEDALKWLDER